MFSIVIPLYKSAENVTDLVNAMAEFKPQFESTYGEELEIILVDDGCPQDSGNLAFAEFNSIGLPCTFVSHAKNFGSFAAMKTGFRQSGGHFVSAISADLQEPLSLMNNFYETLQSGRYDVVIGTRASRNDPFFSKLSSNCFWFLYKHLINKQIPTGGADIFAMNRTFCEALLDLPESNTSLLGLIYWLGFRRKEISYDRLERTKGKSAWTLKKKIKYLSDSVFSFTDLPIFILLLIGVVGVSVSFLLGIITLVSKLTNIIPVPGYSTTIVTITFFGGLNSLGLGFIGNYVHRTYENTKRRPDAIVRQISKTSN